MPPDQPPLDSAIRSVLVAGGGIVGWSAAAALRRQMSWLAVTIVPHPVAPAALADTMACALPSIIGFHADLGLGEQDAVLRTGSSYRLGSLFSGWAGKRPDYVHAYGAYGRPFGATSFHLQFARLAHQGAGAAFERHAPAATLARAGRMAPPGGEADALFADMEYGLQLDVPRYHAMIRAFALHCAVHEQPGAIAAVAQRAGGLIDHVTLEDGTTLAADLYVDCTGPEARLRGALDRDVEDWSAQGCDRLVTAKGPPGDDLPLLDHVTALAGGWRWRAATPHGTHVGLCYASAFCDDATAARQLRVASGLEVAGAPVTFASGTRRAPWRGNCVAIGDAATVIEPLEWSNLHLAHSAIDRIVSMMPGADCAPVELAEYNRQTYAEACRVRDFVLLHYATASRPEPFWRAARAAALPPSLAHSLSLFRERGRLPVHEEETFGRDSWLAVLFGQGVIPRRVDPLTASIPADDAERALAGLRGAIDRALPQFPTQAAYLAAQMRQTMR